MGLGLAFLIPGVLTLIRARLMRDSFVEEVEGQAFTGGGSRGCNHSVNR
jgi:hypothetical protein